MHGVANGAAHQGKRDETSRSSDALDSFHRVSGFETEQHGYELLFIWWKKLVVFRLDFAALCYVFIRF